MGRSSCLGEISNQSRKEVSRFIALLVKPNMNAAKCARGRFLPCVLCASIDGSRDVCQKVYWDQVEGVDIVPHAAALMGAEMGGGDEQVQASEAALACRTRSISSRVAGRAVTQCLHQILMRRCTLRSGRPARYFALVAQFCLRHLRSEMIWNGSEDDDVESDGSGDENPRAIGPGPHRQHQQHSGRGRNGVRDGLVCPCRCFDWHKWLLTTNRMCAYTGHAGW